MCSIFLRFFPFFPNLPIAFFIFSNANLANRFSKSIGKGIQRLWPQTILVVFSKAKHPGILKIQFLVANFGYWFPLCFTGNCPSSQQRFDYVWLLYCNMVEYGWIGPLTTTIPTHDFCWTRYHYLGFHLIATVILFVDSKRILWAKGSQTFSLRTYSVTYMQRNEVNEVVYEVSKQNIFAWWETRPQPWSALIQLFRRI